MYSKIEKKWILIFVRMSQLLGILPWSLNRKETVEINVSAKGSRVKTTASNAGPNIHRFREVRRVRFSPTWMMWCLFVILIIATRGISSVTKIYLQFLQHSNDILQYLVAIVHISSTLLPAIAILMTTFYIKRYSKVVNFVQQASELSNSIPNKQRVFDASLSYSSIITALLTILTMHTVLLVPNLPLIFKIYICLNRLYLDFGFLTLLLLFRGYFILLLQYINSIEDQIKDNRDFNNILQRIEKVSYSTLVLDS